MLSLYESLDLAKLNGVREGSKWVDDPELAKKRQELAYSLAQYADANNFRKDPNAPAEAEDDADDEADEEGDEAEDEDLEEEIEAEADPQIIPASDAPSSSGAAGP